MTDRELFIKALNALETQKPFWVWTAYRCEPLEIQDAITALRNRLAQPEQGTGNLLKDAYNAMVEKKTRSQKLREAGFTRRPKGWEKEKDEQEPVADQPLPCPFCGHIGLDFSDGNTYRWGIASCGGCGASRGDIRREYPDEGKWHSEAIAEWNRRTTPPQRKPLTEKEIGAILENINAFGTRLYTFARAIEAAHGITE